MKVRCVSFAFVSAAFLAAFATNGSSAFAGSLSEQTKLTREAYAALQTGDADGAILAYSQAIESRLLEPEVLANALLNRALAFQQKGEDRSAVDDYTSALSLDAMSTDLRATALYNRGLSHQRLRAIAVAIEDFTSALLLKPEFAHAFYSRGNALRESGQLLFALSDYERAVRYRHPDLAKVHFGEAMTYLALRRPNDARKALNQALAADPQHAGALEQLEKLGASAAAAPLDVSDSDPILTGSVAAFSGGTVAKKPDLPKPVDVPEEMATKATVPAQAKPRKLIRDRVPAVENARFVPELEAAMVEPEEEPEPEQKTVVLDDVPAIPEPESALIADAGLLPAAAEPSPEEVAEAVAEPAPEPVAAEAPAEPAVEPASEAETDAPRPTGWMVQIASAASEEAAWSTWKKMQKAKKVLQGLEPIVVKADLGAKGIFYRVRLNGFDDQGAAKAACGKLKAGGVTCFVSKA